MPDTANPTVRAVKPGVTVRRAAFLAVTAVLAVAAISTPVSAGPPALAGTTVIRASRPAALDVALARSVTLATPFGSSPDLSVVGGGRLSAFVLTGTSSHNRGVTIAGGLSGPNGDRFLMPVPQFPGFGGGSFEQVKTFENSTTIPAGGYRLHIVPDGRTVQFTLRLRGLLGRTTLAPSKPTRADVVPSAVLPPTPVSGNAFVGSATQSFDGRGFALHVLHVESQAAAAWQIVMCHNNPEYAAAGPLRSAPGCPNAEKHTFVNHRAPETTPDSKYFIQAFAGLPAGDHGVSAAYANQGYVTSVAYTTLWLSY